MFLTLSFNAIKIFKHTSSKYLRNFEKNKRIVSLAEHLFITNARNNNIKFVIHLTRNMYVN